jgi:hypothetical protein
MCTGTFGCPQGPTVCVIVDVRPRAIAKCSKGHCIHLLAPPPLLAYHALYIKGYGNRIKNGSHNYCGPANAQGSKAKPASWVRAAESE